MSLNNIEETRRLLDRYYSGETTEKEEARLRDLLMRDDVAEEFHADKEIFVNIAKDVDVPQGLESRLSDAIDGWNARDMVAKAVTRSRRKGGVPGWRRVASIAASVAVVVAIGLTMNHGKERTPADTFSDPQEAYEATEKALMIFANAINRSVEGVEMAGRVSDSTMNTAINEINSIN